MITKFKPVYTTLLALSMVGLLAGCVTGGPEEAASDSDSSRPAGKVIFEFGREDKSDLEFRSSGLADVSEYRCRAGVDCSTEAFPAYLLGAGNTSYAYGGVERIVISFRLKRSYGDVILRLVRGGDETTVVKVDGLKEYLVTSTMLGSGEGFRVGAYDLALGALQKGEHSIELSVADDGKGNAIYQWDALALIARKLAASSGGARKQKVLLIPRERTADAELMLTREVGVMVELLEKAGFEVVVATASGEPISCPAVTLQPDLTLKKVRVSGYVGFMLPCMAAGAPGFIEPQAVAIVQRAAAQGKPVAAQYGSIFTLQSAGVLNGKQYAFEYAVFSEGEWMGTGVVRDGNIITSGTCPYQARSTGRPDGTVELTQRLIEAIGERSR